MQLLIDIDMANAAFGDKPTTRCWEVSRILDDLRTTLIRGHNVHLESGESHALRDANGNTVGYATIYGGTICYCGVDASGTPCKEPHVHD